MYAMMQSKTKSENFTHILGYQIWAVTTNYFLSHFRYPICSNLRKYFETNVKQTYRTVLLNLGRILFLGQKDYSSIIWM